MAKILFIPVSIVGGLIAGLVGKKIFEAAWGLIDKEEPPESEHMMLGSKANWVRDEGGPADRRHDEYPTRSLEDWHRAHGLFDDG